MKNHQHTFTRISFTASVETCECGKWQFTEHAGEPIVEVPADALAMLQTLVNLHDGMNDGGQGITEKDWANARAVIRVAKRPNTELLEALKNLVSIVSELHPDADSLGGLEEARAAIAKAGV